jgi:uncharacterized protein DUF4288
VKSNNLPREVSEVSLTDQTSQTEVSPIDFSDVYIAVIVYACDVDAPDHATLYEESVTLIRANSTEDATAKAEAFAHRPLSQYKNGDGQQVTWTLKGIVDLRKSLTQRLGGEPEELIARHFNDYASYSSYVASIDARAGGPGA